MQMLHFIRRPWLRSEWFGWWWCEFNMIRTYVICLKTFALAVAFACLRRKSDVVSPADIFPWIESNECNFLGIKGERVHKWQFISTMGLYHPTTTSSMRREPCVYPVLLLSFIFPTFLHLKKSSSRFLVGICLLVIAGNVRVVVVEEWKWRKWSSPLSPSFIFLSLSPPHPLHAWAQLLASWDYLVCVWGWNSSATILSSCLGHAQRRVVWWQLTCKQVPTWGRIWSRHV